MCGILGLITTTPVDHDRLAAASRIIAHRGPDDSGLLVRRNGSYEIGLASQRLAILDLSPAGHMPMSSDDGLVHIVYNGEAYNFPELRAGLIAKGHTFRSEGDTEVILHLYLEEGLAFAEKLNGIFGLAIWDERHHRLVLARDRFGIKPLYYHRQGQNLWFGSEIKSLLVFPEVPRTPDPIAISQAVSFHGASGDRTGFRDIHRVLPGHLLVWENGSVFTQRYWDVSFPVSHGPVNEDALAAEFLAILEQAVRRQMVSDVPVGAFLSGGLDSSAIVAMMAKASSHPVQSFTIVYRQQDQRWERGSSEAPYAAEMAHAIGADHHEIVVQPDVVDLLPKIAWHLEEPVGDPAAISTYLIAEAARQSVTVLLAGQGADELLAGYHFYSAFRYADQFSHVPQPVGQALGTGLKHALTGLSRVAPGGMAGKLLGAQRYAGLITDNAYRTAAERHVGFHSYFGAEERHNLFTPTFNDQLGGSAPETFYLDLFNSNASLDALNRQALVDLRTHLPDLILNYTDKLGMAASAEIRVPFLDNTLVDFACRLPPRLKLNGRSGKYLMRKALRGLLPDSVLDRRKAPFGVPIRSWLRSDLRGLVDDLLSEETVRRRGYFQPDAVRRIVDQSRQSVGRSAHQVWALLMLEIWHQVFIDRTVPS